MDSYLGLFCSLALVFILLLGSELYWRRHKKHGELSRKFIHITVGSFVAFWPFFLSWGQILFLSVAFLVVISVSKYFRVFQAIHTVTRPTYGELFFAVAVGATTLVTHNKYLFAAALLQMSLADGMAAIVGTRYGKNNTYHIGGHAKSLAGSATFVLVSLFILAGYGVLATATLLPATLLIAAFSTALIENIGIYGSDNLLVPLVTVYLLTVS